MNKYIHPKSANRVDVCLPLIKNGNGSFHVSPFFEIHHFLSLSLSLPISLFQSLSLSFFLLLTHIHTHIHTHAHTFFLSLPHIFPFFLSLSLFSFTLCIYSLLFSLSLSLSPSLSLLRTPTHSLIYTISHSFFFLLSSFVFILSFILNFSIFLSLSLSFYIYIYIYILNTFQFFMLDNLPLKQLESGNSTHYLGPRLCSLTSQYFSRITITRHCCNSKADRMLETKSVNIEN